MDAKTWYLGPLGNLRPLVSPDGGVSRPVERFGGVHQALSGARTMDITGHRATYKLELPWLTPSDSRFLEALHYRTVPGPFYLLDPLNTNRLSRDAALLRPYSPDVVATSGGVYRSADAPDVGVPVTSFEWSTYGTGATLTLPPVPVIIDETVTASAWVRTSGTMSVRLSVAFSGLGNTILGTATEDVTPSGTWTRYSVTAAVPDGAATARLSFAPTGGTSLMLAAAQLEDGDAPSEWDMGGGAPVVLLDQLDRSSTNYPRNELSVTLLEV